MILVTGGAGFIGSYLVAELGRLAKSFNRGTNPIALVDHLGHGEKWRNLIGQPLAAIIEPKQLPEFLTHHGDAIKLVFHMGASSATTETNVDFILQQNFHFTMELARFCHQRKIKFLYASSASVYGDGQQGFVDNNDLANHQTLRPLNPYGWSKWLVDAEMLRLYQYDTNWSWAGLRFFNVYGPNEAHKAGQRSVALQMLEAIKATGRVTLFRSANPDYGDGEQKRDFVWVGDCTKLLLWLGFTDKKQVAWANGIYNCGSGKAESFLTLAEHCFAAMAKPMVIDWVATPPAIARHYQYYTKAEMGRIRDQGYDFAPTSLKDGINQYAAWFSQQNNQ